MIDMAIVGFDDVQRLLERFPEEFARRVMRAGLRGAARPVAVKARSLAPRETGLLRRSIRVAASRHRKRRRRSAGLRVPIIQVIAGPRPKQTRRNSAFYALFVERGTQSLPARPYLRPAFDSTRPQQIAGMKAAAGRATAQVLRTLAAEARRG